MPQEEIKNYNKAQFTIKTTIVYIDDPADGLAPEDSVPTDYKRAEVRVSWQGENSGEVLFVTDISPNTVEESVGGGILSINVKDADNDPVSNAEVHIYNDQVSPIIDANYLTNEQGNLTLLGLPESIESYQITVTKAGYNTDRTYGKDEVTTPLKPHASIFNNQTTEIGFSIDLLATMNINTTGSSENGYPPIGNVEFELRGEKIIGTDALGDPAYKTDQIFQTDSSGLVEIPNLEWDSYTFSIVSPEGLDIEGIESPPGTSVVQPIDLLPGEIKDIRLILSAQNSCLVKVYDASTNNPIFSASVRLYNGTDYDQTIPTNSNGESLFIPLEEGNYTLEVQMDGYNSYTENFYVSGDTIKEVYLPPL
ncbi:MAG: carboxypeptidase regulatory-like domain-containing protein [Candidatus Omnitrophota bacterium]